MAVQCFAGNCARGMSLVALHNGGGVGIGKAINGGFGMVCDGSERVDEILRSAMLWDVMGGVARRSWARNPHAMETSEAFNQSHAGDYGINNAVCGGRRINKEDGYIYCGKVVSQYKRKHSHNMRE